jgi:hypothetical protein
MEGKEKWIMVVSSVGAVLVAVGLFLPLYTYDKDNVHVTGGVRYLTIKVDGVEDRINMWTKDCVGSIDDTDKCNATVSMLKCCISFCGIGLFFTLVLLVSFFDVVPLVPSLKKKLSSGHILFLLCAVFVFYTIGLATALGSYPKNYSGTEMEDDIVIGAGSWCLIIGTCIALLLTLSVVYYERQAAANTATKAQKGEACPLKAPGQLNM